MVLRGEEALFSSPVGPPRHNIGLQLPLTLPGASKPPQTWMGGLDSLKEFAESGEWSAFYFTCFQWRTLLDKTVELITSYLIKSPLWIPPLWLDVIILRFHIRLANDILCQSAHWAGPEAIGEVF